MSTCAFFLHIHIFSLLRTKCLPPPPHFCIFVMSPIGFVGREEREGLKDARAASFWKKRWRAKPKMPLQSNFSGACIQFVFCKSVIRYASLNCTMRRSAARREARTYSLDMSICAFILHMRIFSPLRTKCPFLTFMHLCHVANRICWPREAGRS